MMLALWLTPLSQPSAWRTDRLYVHRAGRRPQTQPNPSSITGVKRQVTAVWHCG